MLSALVALSLLIPAGTVVVPQRPWRINESNTLIWNEKPYLPVGVRIDGTPQAILEASGAGVKDVIIELPADGSGWDSAFRALDGANMRYILAISSLAPTCTGIAVEPQGYRVAGITTPRKVELTIAGATNALAAMVTKRDGTVQMTKRVKMPDGRFSLDVDPGNDLEHILIVYPIVNELRVPDYWSAFDARRDELINSLRAFKPGSGFRGILNPMGALVGFPGNESQFVPTNAVFRLELEAHLREKYTSVQAAIRSWSLGTNQIDSFPMLAKYVPLWSGSRGISQIWNPDNDDLITCESKRSTAWQDIQEVLRTTATRRYTRLVQSIQSVADVPVLQDFTGWPGPYAPSDSALNGVGMLMEGNSPASIVESGARASSTVLRWNHPGWLVVSGLDLVGEGASEAMLPDMFADATSMGARGWFVRARTETMRQLVGASSVGKDETLASWKPSPLFYPEAATNPAAPTRLPGGRWWLPSPAGGNRVDLGPNYAAYRYSDGSQKFVALWSVGAPRKTTVRLANLKNVVFETIDGSQTGAKVVRNGIELTIPTTPILLRGSEEIPVPQDAVDGTVIELNGLILKGGSRPGIGEEAFRLSENVAALERNPGGAFDGLRQSVHKLNIALGSYVWIEGETSKETNFSETMSSTGTSRGTVLNLRSRLPSPPEGYFATYNPTMRVEGEHEIWVAARIPGRYRDGFSVRIGDQVLKIQKGPLSLYGNGFGWFKMGQVSVVKGPIQLQIAMDSKEGADIAIDAVLLIPGRFDPNGIYPPKAMGS